MRLGILLKIGIVCKLWSSIALGATPAFKPYPVDFTALKKHPKQAAEFERLHRKFQSVPLLAGEHEYRMKLLASVLEKEPEWLDGYWLYAADAYFIGSIVQDPSHHGQARAILVQGVRVLDDCLKRQPEHLLCRFFSASLQAKIASIDGIFASLRSGKKIRDIWLDVTRSPYDLQFRPNVSLQGSAQFALGLFYRLVPDNFIMDWFWDIRGNMDSSISYHREAMALDPKNPCAHLMLAVVLLCKVKGDAGSPAYSEAMKLLENTEKEQPVDLAQEVCIVDAPKIRQDPRRTCGYTQAKYQDEVKDEDLKNNKPSDPPKN